MADRILGQDTEIRIIMNGGVEESLTDVMSFSTTDKLEIKEQGYLGETTNRHSQVYSGTSGDISFHLEKGAAFKFKQNLIDRARRKVGYFKVNVLSTFIFPGGDTFRILFPDIQVGSPKVEDSKREDFVAMSFSWACDSPKSLD